MAIDLVTGVRELLERRKALCVELRTIERQIEALRRLFLSPAEIRAQDAVLHDEAAEDVEAAVRQGVDDMLHTAPAVRATVAAEATTASHGSVPRREPRVCSRCGKTFEPKPGAGGTYCSTECARGGPGAPTPDERRAAILHELQRGPAFPGELVERLDAYRVSPKSVYGDLARLEQEGRLERDDKGWRLVGTLEARPEPERRDASLSGTAPAPSTGTPSSHTTERAASSTPFQAERRCARCLHKFRPTSAVEFICAECIDKPSRHAPAKTVTAEGKDFDVVFSGADSLSAVDTGSSLVGERRVSLPRLRN